MSGKLPSNRMECGDCVCYVETNKRRSAYCDEDVWPEELITITENYIPSTFDCGMFISREEYIRINCGK